MAKPVSVQLYSVRDEAGKDFTGVLRKIGAMGYAGVEMAGLHGKSVKEVAAVLKEAGLKASGAHVAMPTRQNIDGIAADARALGYHHIVSGFGPDDMKDEAGANQCADAFTAGVEAARGAGLSLCMHNHWWEFDRQFAGKTPFEIILSRAPGLMSEFDMYWCAKAGQDAAAIARKWSKWIPLMHVKDGNLTPEMVHTALGEGKVPVKNIIEAAGEADLQWLVVELDACATDMMTAVKKSLDWLVKNGLGSGKAN